MTDVTAFDFDGETIRTVMHRGAPHFVAKDVAAILGYANPRQAVQGICKGRLLTRLPTPGGGQELTVIPERDVYRLILRSRKPAAERFEEWVVGTVLPSLRKHGGYVVGQESMGPDEVLARAVLVANSVIDGLRDRGSLGVKCGVRHPQFACHRAISIRTAAASKSIAASMVGCVVDHLGCVPLDL